MNGLTLPDGLAEVLRGTGGRWTTWCFKEPVNAYGDNLDADFEMSGLKEIIEETARLPGRFDLVDEDEANRQAKLPGFLPFVEDYSQIVVFGNTGSGEPFALDYRGDPAEPKVIFFQDGFWRRVAPSFAAFWELLEPCP